MSLLGRRESRLIMSSFGIKIKVDLVARKFKRGEVRLESQRTLCKF